MNMSIEELESSLKKHRGSVFKYYTTSRIGFFDDLMVRFTQAKEFEDVLECQPVFVYHESIPLLEKRAIKSLQREGKFCYTRDMIKSEIKKLRKINYEEEAKKSYTEKLEMIGILSLAKTQYNEHLWNKYAKDGFCIEFDGENNFFSNRRDDPIGTGELFEVLYSDNQVVFDVNCLLDEDKEYTQLKDFYQKKEKWKPEDEVRIIRFRNLADNELDGGKISLFRVPHEAVKTVYFSPNASNVFIEKCRNKMQMTLPRVPLYKIKDISALNIDRL